MRASILGTLALAALFASACGSPAAHAPPPPPLASAPPPQPAPAERTLRYSFLLMDHVAGGSVVTIHADGSRDATWEYTDRGRGPKQQTHYEIARDGTLSRLDTTGVDYLKQPVGEHLTSASGTLTWKNDAEQGSAPATPPAGYVAMQGAPDLFAALVRAILGTPDRELALLPSGRARATRVGDRTVGANGRSMHVTCYEVQGLGFQPAPTWLDDDRESFGTIDPWASVVREGWEAVVPQLMAFQRDAQAARLGALARKLGHVAPGAGLAIVHARLFDVEKKKVVPDATIVVKGDRIVAAGAGARTKVPAGVETFDAKGMTAIPGLWDMHSHVSPTDGLLDPRRWGRVKTRSSTRTSSSCSFSRARTTTRARRSASRASRRRAPRSTSRRSRCADLLKELGVEAVAR